MLRGVRWVRASPADRGGGEPPRRAVPAAAAAEVAVTVAVAHSASAVAAEASAAAAAIAAAAVACCADGQRIGYAPAFLKTQ